MFKGETLRGLLLTSYGFSVFGDKGGQVETVAFIAALVLLLASLAGLVHFARTPKDKVVHLGHLEPNVSANGDRRRTRCWSAAPEPHSRADLRAPPRQGALSARQGRSATRGDRQAVLRRPPNVQSRTRGVVGSNHDDVR